MDNEFSTLKFNQNQIQEYILLKLEGEKQELKF